MANRDFKAELLQKLNADKDNRGATIIRGTRSYTIPELITEIEFESEFGQELVRLYEQIETEWVPQRYQDTASKLFPFIILCSLILCGVIVIESLIVLYIYGSLGETPTMVFWFLIALTVILFRVLLFPKACNWYDRRLNRY